MAEGKLVLDTGREVTTELITAVTDEATESLADIWAGPPNCRNLLAAARDLLVELSTADEYADYLTSRAYELIP